MTCIDKTAGLAGSGHGRLQKAGLGMIMGNAQTGGSRPEGGRGGGGMEGWRGKKGGYALVVRFPGGALRLGGREVVLGAGTYVYSGSALNGIAGRIEHHRKKFHGSGGKRHWHIDYLLGSCESAVVVCAPSEGRTECRLVAALASMDPVEGFGSTDCRSGCRGHLLRSSLGFWETVEAVAGAFRAMGLEPSVCARWERSCQG